MTAPSVIHDLGLMLQREEAFKSPKPKVQSLKSESVCAWCEGERPEAERNRGAHVSHGICLRHKRIMEAQLEALRRVA